MFVCSHSFTGLPTLTSPGSHLHVDRQALVLTEYHGLTQKELAERLGHSLSGARSRAQRAREQLKQQLLDCCHFEFDLRGDVLDWSVTLYLRYGRLLLVPDGISHMKRPYCAASL
ncbi:MAG: sigma factor-like helix-turn-helix DNA-binding protein [Ktedonobacterales bacterium]